VWGEEFQKKEEVSSQDLRNLRDKVRENNFKEDNNK
jgi:hypothetical protein